ncbi:hypothetical protein OG418_49495 [Streptomyces phaeochromogenes]|uniref:hypothetical protein n=1 Tax=Streptomyces phaeochromogenes TaxID=1923 RepID=UPI00324603AB
MATATTWLRHYRRNMRRSTLALSTVALAVGLVLGSGAISPASANEHQGTEQDGTVHIQTLAGPYNSWDQCRSYRQAAQSLGYSTTPCWHDPQGWFFQFF